MSAIDNAVLLMNSSNLMSKLKAVSVYVARSVVVESNTVPNHDKRLQLAQTVVLNPAQHNVLLLNIIACDPDVCGPTGDANQITDALLIQKVSDIWTPLANMLHQ